jgi:hypothetical protein
MKFSQAELIEMSILCKFNTDLSTKISQLIEEQNAEEKRRIAEEQKQVEAIPLSVPNFKDVKIGTLVARSKHYIKEFCKDKDFFEIGIITELKFFSDDLCGIITYPVIHWQDTSHTTINHPINVELYRQVQPQFIVMNANQQTSTN